jgi:hypothetical protein
VSVTAPAPARRRQVSLAQETKVGIRNGLRRRDQRPIKTCGHCSVAGSDAIEYRERITLDGMETAREISKPSH